MQISQILYPNKDHCSEQWFFHGPEVSTPPAYTRLAKMIQKELLVGILKQCCCVLHAIPDKVSDFKWHIQHCKYNQGYEKPGLVVGEFEPNQTETEKS